MSWIATIKRVREPSQKVSRYKYYAVLLDPYGRILAQGETHTNASDAWNDAHEFFMSTPDDAAQ